MIDLDTIDVSNLNRQFLFRPHHVGRSKADVAREAGLKMNPRATVVAYHANVITDPRFNLRFYEQFTLIFNALDNMNARSHVNKMCVIAGRPLLEAGTSGHLGQAFPIVPRVTKCYDCDPKSVPKTFALCTIRSIPEKPVHCVQYGKELYTLLVGKEDESSLHDSNAATAMVTEEDLEKDPNVKRPVKSLLVIFPRPDPATAAPEEVRAYARRVFNALFCTDIEARLHDPEDGYKTAHVRPRPISAEDAESGVADAVRAATTSAGAASASSSSSTALPDQRILSLSETARLFIDTLVRFYTDEETKGAIGALTWDKDRPLDLDLVTSACNLRASIFGIPPQSRFDVKSIAGNIIPAIATSNAMVAGMQVMEALKLLRDGTDGSGILQHGRLTFLCPHAHISSYNLSLQPMLLDAPSPACEVCTKAYVRVAVDTNRMTLEGFVEQVLKRDLRFRDPGLVWSNGSYYPTVDCDPEDDGDMEVLHTPLATVFGGALGDGGIVRIDENEEGRLYSCGVYILHVAGSEANLGPAFMLAAANTAEQGAEEAARKAEEARVQAAAAEDERRQKAAAGTKRSREDADGVVLMSESEEEEEGRPHKRSKTQDAGSAVGAGAGAGADASADDDNVIELD